MNALASALRYRFDGRQAALLGAAFLLATLLVAAWLLAAYRLGPATALGAAVAIAVAIVVLRLPVAGVCLALLAAPLEYLAANVGNGSFTLTPSEAILLLTAFSGGIRLLPTLSAARVPAALYGYAGLVLVSITGLFFAVDSSAVVRIVLDWIAFGVVALFISQRPAGDLRLVAISLALAGGILGAMSLGTISDQQAIAGGAIVSNRAAASFAHPTSLALFLLLAFPAAFALGLGGGSGRLKPVMIACGALGLVGLLLTQTRGSIIGAMVALLWMTLKWAPFRRLAIASLGVFAVVLLLSFGKIAETQPVTVLSGRLGTLTLNSRGDARLEIWETVPDIVASKPLLGVGQGNFPAVSPEFDLADAGGAPFDHAHDLFLNVAAELGLVGLGLLLFLLAALVQSAARALSRRGSPLYPLIVAMSASLLAVLVNSISEYPLRENLIMATLMIDIGLLLGMERLTRSGEPAG